MIAPERPRVRWVVRSGSLLLLVWVLVGCDHVTKHAAKAALEGEAAQPLIRNVLALRYAENRDIAFNLLSWLPTDKLTPALLVTGTLVSLLLAAALFTSSAGSRWRTFALAAMLSGAIGNTLDRALRGYVIDFVHVSYWPVFNVADVYLTLGMFVLLLLAVAPAKRPSLQTP